MKIKFSSDLRPSVLCACSALTPTQSQEKETRVAKSTQNAISASGHQWYQKVLRDFWVREQTSRRRFGAASGSIQRSILLHSPPLGSRASPSVGLAAWSFAEVQASPFPLQGETSFDGAIVFDNLGGAWRRSLPALRLGLGTYLFSSRSSPYLVISPLRKECDLTLTSLAVGNLEIQGLPRNLKIASAVSSFLRGLRGADSYHRCPKYSGLSQSASAERVCGV